MNHFAWWSAAGVGLVLLATALWLLILYAVIRLAVSHGVRDAGVIDQLQEIREVLLLP